MYPSMAIVFANTSLDLGDAIGSTHRMCAERLFLEKEIDRARRRGVRSENMVRFIKRKIGHIFVFRLTKNGDLATSCPCAFCRQRLVAFDLFVTYIDAGGFVVDRVHASQLPDGVLTSSQRLGRHIH